ncbi:hypothetical protein FACS1894130_12220 [Spirochaetia bacterium]|nr:hypothetical protein FACS1894130_12220 [Spirochaetia bacterium]
MPVTKGCKVNGMNTVWKMKKQQPLAPQYQRQEVSVSQKTTTSNIATISNSYNHAKSHPIKYTDPDGRTPRSAFWKAVGVGAFVGAGVVAIAGVAAVSTGVGASLVPLAAAASKGLASAGVAAFATGALDVAIDASINGPSISESRGKNRLDDTGGEPGSVRWNNPGTTGKKYGPDGTTEIEWNSPHSDHGSGTIGSEEHVHRWTPRPEGAPPGKGSRGDPERPTEQDRQTFGKSNSQPVE